MQTMEQTMINRLYAAQSRSTTHALCAGRGSSAYRMDMTGGAPMFDALGDVALIKAGLIFM